MFGNRRLVRVLMLALGGTSVVAVGCLVLMFVVGSWFGIVNDAANALIGCCSLVLAVVLPMRRRQAPVAAAAVLLAAVGAIGLGWGSWLVVTETTGFYLAGLVSTLGVAALGAWLLLAHSTAVDGLSVGTTRLGRVTGAVMVVGALALPAVAAGIDDIAVAPWHAWASGVAWLGLYLLLPIWCFRGSRDLRPSPSPAVPGRPH